MVKTPQNRYLLIHSHYNLLPFPTPLRQDVNNHIQEPDVKGNILNGQKLNSTILECHTTLSYLLCMVKVH